MQLVIAAITTRPWSSSTSSPSSSLTSTASRARLDPRSRRPGARPAGLPRSSSWSSAGGSEAGKDSSIASSRPLPSCSAASGSNSSIASRKAGFASESAIRSWGRFGPGDRRLDVAEVELERVGVGRLLGVGLVEEALLARVGVDQLDLLGRAAGELEVAQRLGVDREDRAGRAELRRHVADRRPVGEAERGQAGAEELDELETTPRSRSISVTVRTRSVAVAPSGSSPSSLKPITCGSSIEIGWPSIAASASIPPTPQPSTPRPLIIVVCESVPTRVSGRPG